MKAPSVHKGSPSIVKEASGSEGQRGVRERGRVKDLDGLLVSELKGRIIGI